MSDRSVFGTKKLLNGFVTIDTEILHNWSVDSVTKRTIAIAALVLLIVGSFPLLTSVRGQQPQTTLEYEVQQLQRQFDAVQVMKSDLAVVIAHQKLEDERYHEQQEFQNKVIYGFIGTSGSLLMALFLWGLHQFGITFGSPDKRRRRA